MVRNIVKNNDDDVVVVSPILNSSASPHSHYFKVYYDDVVDLRLMKEEIIGNLRSHGFKVDVRKGWNEE